MNSPSNGNVGPVVPSNKEAVVAEKSRRILSNYLKSNKKPALQLISKGKENTSVELPPKVLQLLIDILAQMGAGNAISLIPIHAELTTQEAADLLNVSRPYLVLLLKEGKIPYRKVGTKRRILAKDVIKFKADISKKRYKVLEKLSQMGQEMNMGY